jgi:hypothetical protein
MTDSERRRTQVLALMARFNKLGEMLPRDANEDLVCARREELTLILREMKKVQAQIDALVDAENASRRTK